jgi:hypothetical protein
MGRRFVSFSLDILVELCKQDKVTAVLCVAGLPADARAISASVDATGRHGIVDLIVESAEWAQVREGATLPREDVKFQTLQSLTEGRQGGI